MVVEKLTTRHGLKDSVSKFLLLWPPSLTSLTPARSREDINVGRMHVTQGRAEQPGARGQVHPPVQKREEKAEKEQK